MEIHWEYITNEGEKVILTEEIRFVSSASTWDEWKLQHYYDAVRDYITVQRRRNAVRNALANGSLRHGKAIKKDKR